MSDAKEIDRYVKDPSLLVDLCREVIEQIDSSAEDTGVSDMETQLQEIAKAIERLEKAGVAIPDALRGEKSRLVTALAIHSDSTQALTQLASELDDILNNLRSRLGRSIEGGGTKRPRIKRAALPKTSNQVLRGHIIAVLKEFGGRAKVSDVLSAIEARLDGKLLPADLELRQDGKTKAWRNNVQWERLRMTHDGTLCSNSPNGIWELGGETSIQHPNQESNAVTFQYEDSLLESMEHALKKTKNWECGRDAHCVTCPYEIRGSTLLRQEACVKWSFEHNLISAP